MSPDRFNGRSDRLLVQLLIRGRYADLGIVYRSIVLAVNIESSLDSRDHHITRYLRSWAEASRS